MPIVIKHTIPGKYNLEPYKTVWKVEGTDNPDLKYIQISKDEQSPNWVTIGDFLQLVFKPEIEKEEFLEECFKKLS
jgi:hypothetical protein